MIKKETGWRGMTLAELMTVIAIITLISIAGSFSFSSLIGDKFESDCRKIISDLCWARQMAVSTHQDYIADFDAANKQYSIYRGSVALNNRLKLQGLTLDSISFLPAFPAQVRFNFPQGISLDKQIILNYQGKTKVIIIFGDTGYVRIQ